MSNKNIKKNNSYEWLELQTKERRATRTLGRIVVTRDSNFISREKNNKNIMKNNSCARFEL
jgi:hypothetical protein